MTETFQVRGDDEADDPLMLFGGVGGRKHDIKIGISSVGNSHLSPIENVVIPVEDGGGPHGSWIRSSRHFTQTVRSNAEL
jgi:hypothetical protein